MASVEAFFYLRYFDIQLSTSSALSPVSKLGFFDIDIGFQRFKLPGIVWPPIFSAGGICDLDNLEQVFLISI